MPQGG